MKKSNHHANLRNIIDYLRLSNLLLLYKSCDILSKLEAKELMVKWHQKKSHRLPNLVATVCNGSKWHISNLSSSYTVVCNKAHRDYCKKLLYFLIMCSIMGKLTTGNHDLISFFGIFYLALELVEAGPRINKSDASTQL
jgi:hypothetical protein